MEANREDLLNRNNKRHTTKIENAIVEDSCIQIGSKANPILDGSKICIVLTINASAIFLSPASLSQ